MLPVYQKTHGTVIGAQWKIEHGVNDYEYRPIFKRTDGKPEFTIEDLENAMVLREAFLDDIRAKRV